MSLRFLANDALVETEAWGMTPALDIIRREFGLTGTKEGCREGDCGACAVMVGTREGGGFSYAAMPSCLLALGELEGRHLVTIEGLAARGLTPVMRALAEANGSQCGFCSPGFVISLTAYLLGAAAPTVEGAFSAVEGNLCRCTGYGAIKRAAARLVSQFADLPADPLARLDALVDAGVLPASCSAFARGELLKGPETGGPPRPEGAAPLPLGGGTDFFVRNPEPDRASFPAFELLDRRPELRRVERRGKTLELGAALSWRKFFSDPRLLELVPGLGSFEKLLASPLVRERATIGGNIANASPVGDITAILIALGARVRLDGAEARELPLERLFLGYKKLDLGAGEIVAAIILPAEGTRALFNFEKVSKRERLDIAVVNSAACFEAEKGEPRRIRKARVSAGGVAPVPLFLAETSAFLEGRVVDANTALEAARLAASEISPIADVRGGSDYRRRLLQRLILGHFVRLFPGSGVEEAIE